MSLGKTEAALDTLTGGSESKIQLDVALAAAYSAGLLSFDSVYGTVVADTGITDVRVHIGQDVLIPVYNGTGGTLTKGTPVAGGGTYASGLPSVIEADADNILHVLGFLGIVTEAIDDTNVGFVTSVGAVTGLDTDSFSEAPVYLASGGGLTNTIPLYPTHRLLIGGITVSHVSAGVIGVAHVVVPRNAVVKDYNLSTGSTGSHYIAGFYDWSTTDVTLNQGSPTQTHGISGQSRAAHAGIVPSAAGSVDIGQVGLRVTGTKDSETGAQVAAQTGIVTEDITTLTTDLLAETAEKFSGQITFELYIVSGSPTTYSLTFNYGFSAFEDFASNDVTLHACEMLWEGNATESGMDILIMHHKATGWTYAATGFVVGNGAIVQRSVDQAIEYNVANGVQGKYKRTDLAQFIEGSANDGVLIRVDTATTNSIANMNLYLHAHKESLD